MVIASLGSSVVPSRSKDLIVDKLRSALHQLVNSYLIPRTDFFALRFSSKRAYSSTRTKMNQETKDRRFQHEPVLFRLSHLWQ